MSNLRPIRLALLGALGIATLVFGCFHLADRFSGGPEEDDAPPPVRVARDNTPTIVESDGDWLSPRKPKHDDPTTRPQDPQENPLRLLPNSIQR